jgi:hypothetical protein
VVGKVYCYRCYDWGYPVKSHDKKHLKGTFGVKMIKHF